MASKNASKAKNFILGLGIFIVYMFALGVGIQAFYPTPEYSDFCMNDRFVAKPIALESNCKISDQLSVEEQECYSNNGNPIYEYDDEGCRVSVSECDLCQNEWDDARSSYNNVLFIVALIIGVITIIIGYFVLHIEPVGSSLIASGIGGVIYGIIRNLENLSAIWRFVLLVVVLVLLIWFALRLNKKK